jgi:hypothetical protein
MKFCEKREFESIEIGGATLRPGSRVILQPHGWLEIIDQRLRGKVAVVESIEQDYEERLFVAVTVGAGDKDAENGQRTRNRFFFRPDEIELIDSRGPMG